MSYTAYSLLKALTTAVKAGDLDSSLASMQEIFYAELFGQVADEKDVEAIRVKCFEAQFIKAYDAYELLAKCVSSNCLNQLLQPIKGVSMCCIHV